MRLSHPGYCPHLSLPYPVVHTMPDSDANTTTADNDFVVRGAFPEQVPYWTLIVVSFFASDLTFGT